MKKLILIVVLLFSLTVSAQEQQTFQDFTKAQITEREVTGECINVKSRIFFNYGGDENKVKIYIGNLVDTYTIDSVHEDITVGGFKYLAVFLSSAENKLVLMQIFEDTDYGVRIFFDANNYVQITN